VSLIVSFFNSSDSNNDNSEKYNKENIIRNFVIKLFLEELKDILISFWI
jgi:hypothetical protein